MRWIQYADTGDHAAAIKGRPREGQAWAAPGPFPGTIWVIPSDEADRLYAVVHVYPNAPEKNYSLDSEQGTGRWAGDLATELGTGRSELALDQLERAESSGLVQAAELGGGHVSIEVHLPRPRDPIDVPEQEPLLSEADLVPVEAWRIP